MTKSEVYLLDSNVLIALATRGHSYPDHSETLGVDGLDDRARWVARESSGSSQWLGKRII